MISQAIIADVIAEALSNGADFAEVFIEHTDSNGIVMIGGKVDKANRGQDYGIGIRIFKGTNSVYGYTNDSNRDNLLKTAREIAAALKGETLIAPLNLTREYVMNQHLVQMDLDKVPAKLRIEKMKQASDYVKNYHTSISQNTINLLESKQHVLIANSEGRFVEDTRVRTRLYISAVASNGSEMQTGGHGPGAHQGFEFIENLDIKHYAEDAARIAVTMLNAEKCPSGKMPVVIDNGFGGVIFHEACGHGLEATSVAKGLSVFCDKLGEKVASDCVTAIDDGTFANDWGSLNIDDEGTPTQQNVLIENGILKGYLIDKLNSRRMKMDVTGSSRRQNYRYAPTSRMTNTYIANGKSTLNEIITNTEFGLYAKNMGGGSVNPGTGDFNFAVTEGYIIRNGQIAEPVRGATLIGNGPQILHQIDMVGNNLAHAQGMCGSVSGSIPTNVGQPALRVKEITVGGAKGE
ncbi:MAG TPA: peptidase C69 [Firmicutes bacterium]|nr:peptidase C69 [Bacillota bacterium]